MSGLANNSLNPANTNIIGLSLEAMKLEDFGALKERYQAMRLAKRAEAVLRTMVLLGAPEAQLEAVSFGEERPAVPGSGEEVWEMSP